MSTPFIAFLFIAVFTFGYTLGMLTVTSAFSISRPLRGLRDLRGEDSSAPPRLCGKPSSLLREDASQGKPSSLLREDASQGKPSFGFISIHALLFLLLQAAVWLLILLALPVLVRFCSHPMFYL
jgi:hypothetical protein